MTPLSSWSAAVSGVGFSPSTDLNVIDLELLHQYITSTCIANAQLPEITIYIQQSILPLAQMHLYVMRGILAMAAVHLSRLRPEYQAYYEMIATKHHNNAMSDFRSALQNINQANFEALISFSKGLLWSSLAKDPKSSGLKSTESTEDNWLPQWFHLLRGSCSIVESSRVWITKGPHLRANLDITLAYLQDTAVAQISTLISNLQNMTESPLCTTVLSALRESFARACIKSINTPYRSAINFWIASLPDEYYVLLQKDEPWALVALSYFCVLLYHSEPTWFIRINTTNLLLSITNRLDCAWQGFVEYPCSQLGILRTRSP